jgi:hypothetical protein
MNKFQSKYLIIPIILLFILLFIYFVFLLMNKPGSIPSTPFFPSPTINKLKITPAPTLIPAAFTGAADDPGIPQEEIDLSTQKYNLRKKTPMKLNGFSILFDYQTDKFNVILLEPKDSSRILFSSWLSENYPLIPLNRFVIQ